jgi:uncharacterized protein (TIGR02147 family)
MPSYFDIFSYDDYRLALRDLLEMKKSENAKFSMAYFSKKIGVSSSYLKQIIAARRNLRLERARDIAAVFGLSGSAMSYFLTLVLYKEATTPVTRDYFARILRDLKNTRKQSYSIESELLQVMKNSLTWEIYTLTGTCDFQMDASWIANALGRQKLTVSEIEVALRFLKDNGLVRFEDGRWKGSNFVLPEGPSTREIHKVAHNRTVVELDMAPQEADYFDSFCLVLGESEIQEVRNILEEAKRKVAAVIKDGKEKSRIAHYQTAFYLV